MEMNDGAGLGTSATRDSSLHPPSRSASHSPLPSRSCTVRGPRVTRGMNAIHVMKTFNFHACQTQSPVETNRRVTGNGSPSLSRIFE